MNDYVRIHKTTIERLISVIEDIVDDYKDDDNVRGELESLIEELNDILEEKEKYCLVGVDGNAYSIMSYVTKAMKECEKSKEDIKKYQEDAMSSDYNHLICVSQEMIDSLNKGR